MSTQNVVPRHSTHLRCYRKPFLTGFLAGTICTTAVLISFLVVMCFFVGVTAYGDEPSAAIEKTERAVGEIRRDVVQFLKNSKQDDMDLQVGAILDLCELHDEIVNDSRFSHHRQLQSLRAQTASRLKKYLKTIEIETLRKMRREKKSKAEINKRILAGETPPLERGDHQSENGLISNSDSTIANAETSLDQEMEQLMAISLHSLGGVTGGPSELFGYLHGNHAPPWDHGEDLVNLIKNVINPDFWRSNGGEGIIYYYRPSRVLIIGATSRIQDDVTNILRNMRN